MLRQCIKLLPCDFTGLAKDKLVEQYVKSCSVEVVTSNVLRLLGDRSLEVLKAPIKDRARAVSMLPEIDQQHNGRGVYANVLEIPARSIFWEYAADMVKLYEGNENDYVPVMYIGSAARLIQCFYKRLFLCHEKEHHGARYPCLHHDAWKAADSHKFVKFAEGGPEDPPGLLRITEAVTTGSHRKESLPRYACSVLTAENISVTMRTQHILPNWDEREDMWLEDFPASCARNVPRKWRQHSFSLL